MLLQIYGMASITGVENDPILLNNLGINLYNGMIKQ